MTTTVSALIEVLKHFPPDLRVMVRGYESGYDDPEPLCIAIVRIDPFESDVYGKYEVVPIGSDLSFPVVLIDRPGR